MPRGEAVFASGRVIVRESDQHRLYVVEVLAADGSVLGVSMIDVDADGEEHEWAR